MKNVKKIPSKQLEKFSNIFMHLGLVLVLFMVYIVLEYQTEQITVALIEKDVIDNKVIYVEPDADVFFIRERKITPKVEIIKAQPFIIDEVVKGNNTITEIVFDDIPDEDPTIIDIDALVVVKEPEDFNPEDAVPFMNLQNAPVFKGCENLSKDENKVCFDKKMKQFVQRNFDIALANKLGLHSGNHKIQTQFIINQKGSIIDVKIRAPHKKLKQEAQRIINKLPRFKPGKQNSRTVKVRYLLPITFKIE
jgi:protein TonB